jgi:2-polyprenyl-3-methyl-5-hydroxy-6-metoxy-1,4-benzoquinol methylase
MTQSTSQSVCPNCGYNEYTLYFSKPAHNQVYQIVRCGNCALLYVRNMPTADELTVFYNSVDYFSGDERGYRCSYLQQQFALEKEAGRRLAMLEQLLTGLEVGSSRKILDIGCAAGFFLSVAKKRAWQIEGVELSQTMAAHARKLLGIEIKSAFDPTMFPDNSYSSITLWEVIEHLSDPLMVLRQVRQLLVPGGLIALSTPNTGHWQAQRRPEWWSEFKPPAHLIYFTETTLCDMLRRAGFANIVIQRIRPLAISPQTLATLHQLRDIIGDGANRRTFLWPLTSLIYRLTSSLVGVWHHRQYPDDDLYVGLEAYACKPE